MTIKTFRCSEEYLDIITTIMEKRKFKYMAEAIRFGLDLAKLKLKGVKIKKYDVTFVTADQKTGNALEFKLAGKLTSTQLVEYKEKYEPNKISISDYCKEKNILQEYF